MGNPLLGVAWENCVLEFAPDAALDAETRRVLGVVPSWAGYLSSNPWLVRALLRFYTAVERAQRIEPLLAGQLMLVVSQDNSCRYCYAVVRLMLRLQGLSEARVQLLEAQLTRALPDARAAAAVRFARKLSRCAPRIDATDLAALREAGFDDDQIREMALVVAYEVMCVRAVTLPAIPPQEMERMPQRWFFGLLRPLMRRLLDANTRRLRAAPPSAVGALQGPFSALMQTLAGREPAAAIAQTMHELWASTALPRRTKLLMIAVVGRALECRRTVDEAITALEEEGLDRAAVDAALLHLRGGALTGAEPQLLDFARETVWYQAAQIQRKAHALSQGLTREQFVEAVGVCSLANGLCRLRAALEVL